MATNCKNDAPGMKGCRSRDENGELRLKRSDTKIKTIEKQYNIDLGVRGDMLWGNYKDLTGVKSLHELITKK
ncbi:hypothetical protein IT413_03450 [Candidatus Peregrinibacteria bacterium]|nr:hypothetical protein [Candidatus Peregrinibacteria bacterium]